ncbi:MAG: LamG-like jellyroll fold domain-containing protein [Bacteroidota bacterium]
MLRKEFFAWTLLICMLGCVGDRLPEEPEITAIHVNVGDNKLGEVEVVEQAQSSATVEARWLALGEQEILEYGFVWGETDDPRPGDSLTFSWKEDPRTNIGTGIFSHTIEELSPATDYWVRAFAKLQESPSSILGSTVPFSTLGIPPEVKTGTQISVDADRVTVSGTILTNGTSDIIEYGHVAAESGTPSINSAIKSSHDGPIEDMATFESTLTGLKEGQSYFYRAYALNKTAGTPAYGEVKTVRTEALPNLYFESITLVSDHGNMDGKANRGEELEFQFTIKNKGSLAAEGVRLELINNSPYITDISPNLIDLGSIPGGNMQVIEANDIRISIDNLADWDSAFSVQLLLSDAEGAFWLDSLVLTIESPYVLTEGLVAYYTFDRDDQNSLFANSELNNDLFRGIKHNDPTYSTNIPDGSGAGYSMKFDATNSSFLNVLHNPLFGLTDRTYSFWLKTDTANSYLIVEKKHANKVFFLSLLSGFRYYYIFLNNPHTFGVNTDLVTDNMWHMVAVTISGNQLNLYIDGELLESRLDASLSQAYNSVNEGVSIGANRSPQTTTVSGPFDGLLDNIRFYDRTLTSDEIREIFQAKQ